VQNNNIIKSKLIKMNLLLMLLSAVNYSIENEKKVIYDLYISNTRKGRLEDSQKILREYL